MAETSKRIDLAAPLLSVRRHGKGGTGTRYGERTDDDATLGGVPFGWEHWPGRPKSVRTITRRAPPLLQEPDEPGRSSDALSRADSCYTVNCSVAGLSDAAGATVSPGAHGSSVMMDRFLMAAKEQCAFRKAKAGATNTRARDGDSLPSRLPVHHPPASRPQSSYVKDTNGDEEDEWDAHSTAGFASGRKCGLLPTRCAKTLNPAHAISRHRGGARRFLSDLGRPCRRDTYPLLPQRRPAHDAGMRSWEEALVRLVRSDRACSLRQGATMPMATALDSTVRGLCNAQAGAGAGANPKATHLGLLLVLDRTDGQPPGGGKTSSRRNAAGHVFPPLLEETSRDDIVPPSVLLALPSPKMPTESWLSRTLPSVSTKPPATSFLGIHVQQLRKQHTPPSSCSSDQAKVLHHGARPRRVRIHDLHK